jgi:hypothetical protein
MRLMWQYHQGEYIFSLCWNLGFAMMEWLNLFNLLIVASFGVLWQLA